MTRIVQIAPTIEPGSGVAGVAFALEQEFRAAGVPVERFTAADAGWAPRRMPRSALGARLRHAREVVWFSTVGSRRARRFLASRPDAVAICHNDAMAGDVYVNHGLLEAAMRARGKFVWRMVRNPLHVFTAVRDRVRYRGRTHRAVVALTNTEVRLLTETYGRVRAPIHVIPNGVDVERFRPATDAERRRAREELGLGDTGLVAMFVGHEFERKGLPLVLSALRQVPTVALLVIGGTSDQIRKATAQASELGVVGRVRFAGNRPDPVPYFRASDVFVMPSAYESYGLVITEALASGLPVVSTPVGVAPDVIVDGVNGFLVSPSAEAIGERLAELAAGPLDEFARNARASVADLTWTRAASGYLDLVRSIAAEREVSSARPLRIVHAVRSDGFSGVEQFIVRLARRQAADGHAVRVIGGDPARMRTGLAGSGIPHAPARRTVEVLRAVRSVAAEVDLINTHMTAADIAAGAALAIRRRAARPAVVSTRHFASPRGNLGPLPIDALLRGRIDTEIAISAAVAAAIGVASTVVYTGIEPRPAADPSTRERTVLIAQRLQPEKRTDVGLRAFAASGLADEGWTLDIAGIGPERTELERLAASLRVAASVRFSGYRTDLPDLLARTGILLAPCPIEGLGLTLLEAMASGLPPVAADAAGHVDLLKGLDSRARFAANDPDAAGRCLRALADDPAGRAALGAAARERQQRAFSLDAQAERTEAVYRATIAAAAGRRPA